MTQRGTQRTTDATARKRTTTTRKLLIALGVVAALLLVVDRGAHYLVNRRLNQAAQGATEGAQAQAAGFPFLTQALTGGFSVDLQAPSIQLPREDLRLNDVQASLRGVRGTSLASARAAELDARAIVPFDDLARRANLRPGSVRDAGGGRARVTQQVELFGATVDLAATADLRVDGDAVVVEPVDFEVAGSPVPLTGQLRETAGERLRLRVPLTGLPPGTRLQDVHVAPEGLRVHLTGRDVPLEQFARSTAGAAR